MIEHERSYVFTHEGAKAFLESKGISFSGDNVHLYEIEDFYLREGLRVRKISDDHNMSSYALTHKVGDKAKGYRFESEQEISKDIASLLTTDPVLRVRKTRYRLPQSDSKYTVTMDMIYEPMKVAVLEIEALSEIVYPIPVDMSKKMFDVDLIECPLSACSLFRRKIGICGGPSAGKTECSKILSHVLNTTFDANSFHVAEFATTFIQKYGKNPKFLDSFFVWHGQHEREHNAELANVVISDCPTFLSYIYLLYLPKEKFCDDTALMLSKIYKRVLFDIGSYSDIILLDIKDYVENSVRYQTKEEAMEIQERIRGFLDDHNILYSTHNYSQIDDILKNIFYINM